MVQWQYGASDRVGVAVRCQRLGRGLGSTALPSGSRTGAGRHQRTKHRGSSTVLATGLGSGAGGWAGKKEEEKSLDWIC